MKTTDAQRLRPPLAALDALLFSTLTACTCAETTVSVSVPQAPLAVTASAFARLNSRSCRTFAFDNRGNVGKTDTVCSTTSLDIGEAWVDDQSLFELTTERSVVTLKALAPGVTTLHLREAGGLRGAVYETQLDARRARRVQVDFGCDGGVPHGIVAESKFTLEVKAFDGDVALTGVPERPLTSNALALVDTGSTYLASATPMLGTVTSAHDPALNIAVRVFSVREVTLEVPPPVLDRWGSNTASFWSYLIIDGRRACIDTTVHRLEVLTPDGCNLGQDNQGQLRQAVETYAGSEAVVHGTKGSTCRLRFSIKDSPMTAVELTHAF